MSEELCRQLGTLPSEQKNPASAAIDSASTTEILEIINQEDAKVPAAVRAEIPFIARAVDAIVDAFRSGGRLFYVGAGTSGRLGILDAAECPPTFGTPPSMVQGIIAGGPEAVFRAQEGAEDREDEGRQAIQQRNVSSKDVVCGLAASGRTPFVKAALLEAHNRGATTIFITTNKRNRLAEFGFDFVDIAICPQVGPEVIAGSTRMKAGTAQKLILNMLSTAAMIRLGKVFGNVMVDLQMTSEKLRERARRIVMELSGVDYATASATLELAGGNVKTALVMLLGNCSATEARSALHRSGGFVRQALQLVHNSNDASEYPSTSKSITGTKQQD